MCPASSTWPRCARPWPTSGATPAKINPLSPAELVIDHSVIIDVFGRADAFERNVEIEYQRNRERYQFLRWGQTAFDDFKVVPPGTGIVHQVNIEHLARTVMVRDGVAYPDTCVGTDSHTTMVNGLGVLGWGVGGIEAEAAMLGQPVSMLIPRVVGFKLSGSIPSGATATDVVLTITEMLRDHGVVGKFVEFYGEGVSQVPLANRATIGNMSPEFGSTCAIFPIDDVTLEYLRLTGRSEESVALVEAYAKEQGMWLQAGPDQPEARYSEYLELDLSTVVPSIAGPKRPQDRIALTDAKNAFRKVLPTYVAHHEGDPGAGASFPASDPTAQAGSTADGTNGGDKPADEGNGLDRPSRPAVSVTTAEGDTFEIDHGIVVDRLDHELHQHLQPLGDDGRGHAGQERRRPRPDGGPVGQDVHGAGLEGGLRLLREGRHVALPREARLPPGRLRLHHLHRQLRPAQRRDLRGDQRQRPRRRLGALGQPQLRGPDQPRREDELPRVAAAGHRLRPGRDDGLRLRDRAAGQGHRRQRRLPADLWPAPADVERTIAESINKEMFTSDYADVFAGDERWKSLPTPEGKTFEWDPDSTYVRKPPYFDGMTMETTPVEDISGARVLAKLGDSVTTDHISPAGSIKADSPAGTYLAEHGVDRKDFNSYGSRRGNHEVMIRGTFANIRLKNLLLDGVEGGFTRLFLTSSPVASRRPSTTPRPPTRRPASRWSSWPARSTAPVPRVTGQPRAPACWASRPSSPRATSASTAPTSSAWACIPLQYPAGRVGRVAGPRRHRDVLDLRHHRAQRGPHPQDGQGRAAKDGGQTVEFDAVVRIDTPGEADYYRNGGILQYVLRSLVQG